MRDDLEHTTTLESPIATCMYMHIENHKIYKHHYNNLTVHTYTPAHPSTLLDLLSAQNRRLEASLEPLGNPKVTHQHTHCTVKPC